jgi:hypothetical protein
MRSHKVEETGLLFRIAEIAGGFSQGKDPRADFLGVENAAQFGVVLLPGEHVKSGLGLFTEPLRPIVAGSDFEVETANIAAIVFILDP